ncbi:MAG: universal stress protein [Planctomycetes bacterium]|nr:universal stress protein [Planctomycetota bacterium]
MIQKILTALDGSKTSESILPYLETLLASQDANVTLVRVIAKPSESRTREAAAYLNRLAAGLRARGAIVDEHVLTGSPAPALVDMAIRGGYSLIVMCSRGKSGIKRLLLGSVAEDVLRRSPIPVLIVHPLSGNKGKMKIKRIVVPLDGSHRSGSILAHVEPLAKATGAKLLFMTIIEPKAKHDYPVEVVARNLFREQKRLHKQGIQTELAIRYGDPVVEILSFGDVQNADLVALSTHGRTGVERALYGSVAESVLRKGKLPMLLLRTAGRFIPDPMQMPAIRAQRRKKQLETAGSGTR